MPPSNTQVAFLDSGFLVLDPLLLTLLLVLAFLGGVLVTLRLMRWP